MTDTPMDSHFAELPDGHDRQSSSGSASGIPDLAFYGVREQFMAVGISEEMLAGNLVFMDTETTGFDAGIDAIIEIGAVLYRNGRYAGKYHRYFNPRMSIPDESAAVHGITQERMQQMIADGIAKTFTRRDAANLSLFVQDAVILGHNFVRFDAKFLEATYKRAGVQWVDNRVVDTMSLSKIRFPRNKLNLDSLCKLLKVDTEGRQDFHGALVDAEITARMFASLVSLPPNGDLFAGGAMPDAIENTAQRVRIISTRGQITDEDRARHNALCAREGIEWS